MQTMQAFIIKNRLSITTEKWQDNPDWADSGLGYRHYRVKLTKPMQNGARRQLITYYSANKQGYSPRYRPPLAHVINSLASNSSGYDNAADFEDWAGDLGYDTDPHEEGGNGNAALRTFLTIKRESAKLRLFLGAQAYESLLWETEKL